jgi:hypothetical protein
MRLYIEVHRLGFCCRLSQCLNARTFLMCNWYSPARRSVVTLWIITVTSGTGEFIPLSRHNSNGTETFSERLVQWGLICRYSIFLVPATISASHREEIREDDLDSGLVRAGQP